MRIGIDAKRVYLNKTGLGSYGRNLIKGLNQIDANNEYFLYATDQSDLIKIPNFNKNFNSVLSIARVKAFWRSYGIINNLKRDKIDIYHGISNELPFSLNVNKKIKKIVDIHDLLFLRYPKYYSLPDRKMFEFKTKFACDLADKIVATSLATKNDIIYHYGIKEDKIEVVYQSCDDRFFETVARGIKEDVLAKYNLPPEFVLCVGTIQERKNQKAIIEAMALSSNKLPVVLVGQQCKYAEVLKLCAKKLGVELIFPSQFVLDKDLPAIYQSASIFVFPGHFEGFGIPILEAMASKIPVITSLNTSMAEIVENKDCLIDPLQIEAIKDKIDRFLTTDSQDTIQLNFRRAQQFRNTHFAQNILNVYEGLYHN